MSPPLCSLPRAAHTLSFILSSLVQGSLTMPSSSFFSRASLALLSLTTTAVLQAWAQSPIPPQSWKPSPTCSQGGPNPTGGAYTDKFGGIWDARCGMTFTGTPYESGVGTNGQGWYACAKGCAKRPRCSGFRFISNMNLPYASWSETAGSGNCAFYMDPIVYTTDATVYGVAALVRPNTQMPVSLHDNVLHGSSESDALHTVSFLQWHEVDRQ